MKPVIETWPLSATFSKLDLHDEKTYDLWSNK